MRNYYRAFVLYLVAQTVGSTALAPVLGAALTVVVALFAALAGALLAARLLTQTYTPGLLLRVAGILGTALVGWWLTGGHQLLVLATFVVAAQGVQIREVARRTVVVLGSLTTTLSALALAGLVESRTTDREGVVRLALGFASPGVMAATVLAFVIAWIVWRWEQLTGRDIAWLTLASVAAFWATNTRVTFYVSLVALVAAAVARLVTNRCHRALAAAVSVTAVVAPLVALTVVARYDPGDAVHHEVNTLLSGRLALASRFLDAYGIAWFGQEIDLVGVRDSELLGSGALILDMSYVQLAVRFGVVSLVLIGFGYLRLGRRLSRVSGAGESIAALTFLVTGLSDMHFLDIRFNFLFVLVAGALYGLLDDDGRGAGAAPVVEARRRARPGRHHVPSRRVSDRS